MARISQDQIDKLNEFFDTLPSEVKGKCVLCNETLTHWVKRAEIETGAGLATATRVLAERINQGAAEGDVVKGENLRARVRDHEGKLKRSNAPDKVSSHSDNLAPSREPDQGSEPQQGKKPKDTSKTPFNMRTGDQMTEADQFKIMAITQLERIRQDDPRRVAALREVISWINKQLKEV